MAQQSSQTGVVQDSANTLGVVGFIISLVGLVVTGGLVSPIGLIISLVAMGRQPRGFAIAGVILGVLGSCGLILGLLMFGAALVAFIAAMAGLAIVVLNETENFKITTDMMTMAIAIEMYEQEQGYLPADLGLLDIGVTTLQDPWGNRYEYFLIEEDPGYDLISCGIDGTLGTADDIKLSSLGETWIPGGMGISVDADDQTGTVRINLGDQQITATGDDDGGRVTIKLGDRVVEVVGDDDGGSVRIGEFQDGVDTGETGGDEETPESQDPSSRQ
jgi:hypothetical protein